MATEKPLNDTRNLRKGVESDSPAPPRLPEAQKNEQLSSGMIRKGRAAGAKLLSYEIGELIGSGGMGTVYKAKHSWLGRPVAIKFIAPHVTTDPSAVARFEFEARAIGTLDHPNIVRATDAGQNAGICYLVTEYVDGDDAARLVARRGALTVPDACQIVMQAALGLQHAYEHGLVHRDVKPSNLLINRKGTTKLIDFGIARLAESCTTLTSTGQMLGTLDFLAPEQAGDAHQIDIRADIYSLGCTLYFLLTGAPPFSGPRYQTPAAKIKGHLVDSPPPLGGCRGPVPRGVVACLEKMMAKSPDDRYSTPAEVAEALAPYAEGADLETLVSDDLRYGLGTHARSQDETDDASAWRAVCRRLAAVATTGERVFKGPRGANHRRRPLTQAVAVMILAVLGFLLITNIYVPNLAQWRLGPNPVLPGDMTKNDKAVGPQSSLEEHARLTPPATQAATGAEGRRSGETASSVKPNKTSSAKAPSTAGNARAKKSPGQKSAVPQNSQHYKGPNVVTGATTFTAGTHGQSAVQAPPAPQGWPPAPPGFPAGAHPPAGGEYRELRFFGAPPPGVDPGKLPRGPENGPPPAWARDEIPPFMVPPDAVLVPGPPSGAKLPNH